MKNREIKLVKTETGENEEGLEVAKNYYGYSENEITCTQEILPSVSTQENTEVTQDEINAQILLNQTTILANQALQEEVNAEILLNQVKQEAREHV
ncbi:MAG: hypothetical protein HFJ09_05385 [Lachnospiraceae bacterium]|nr:hypothetical protein [Lachnospiraceae bacterium]